MIPANIIEKMYVHISLGKSRESFRYNITPEMSEFWDELTVAIKEIRERGDSLEMFSEIPEIEIPNPA
jgi:predicted HTH domain antitoxin